MCSFWNVSFLGRALFGLNPLRNEFFLECASFGMCTFWIVPFLECALFGMCPFWNVPYLTDLSKGNSVVQHSERVCVQDKF